jgi:uncharacterized membrane protein YdjX (TVP38/TMEM64 family)
MIRIAGAYRLPLMAITLIIVLAIGLPKLVPCFDALLAFLSSDRLHPLWVILAFLVLPLLFFPITALLVLVGIRFDAVAGVLLMWALIPAHLTVSYGLVRTLLYDAVKRLAEKRDFRIFSLPGDRQLEFGLVFMAVPGLPYAVKNCLLPLTGISFRRYLAIGWLVQGLMGIPFIVLGDAAARWSVHLFLVYALLLVSANFLMRHFRKRYARMVSSTQKEQ